MKYVFAFSLAITLFSSSPNAAPLTVVEEGGSRAVIIITPGEPHARQLAEELQKYIEKMSNAKLDILEEGEAAGAAQILI